MTQSEVLQEKLERWGRALELYVWLGGGADVVDAGGVGADGGSVGGGGGGGTAVTKKGGQIDLLMLLEKLCEGCSGVSIVILFVLSCWIVLAQVYFEDTTI
jgi:hypothetical protein